MKKVIIFFVIAIIVVLPMGWFKLSLKSTRVAPSLSINLVVDQQTNQNAVNISNESLKELNRIISENSILNDRNQILDIFERERSKYIELLTIVSVLLTIFSLFSIATGFIERSESEKIKHELAQLENTYKTQLKLTQWQNTCSYMEGMANKLRMNINLIFYDNTHVDNLEKFEKFMLTDMKSYFNNIDISLLDKETNLQSFAIHISNLMTASLFYCQNKFGLIDSEINLLTQPVQKMIIGQVYSYLPKDKYDKFKSICSKLPNFSINWGEY